MASAPCFSVIKNLVQKHTEFLLVPVWLQSLGGCCGSQPLLLAGVCICSCFRHREFCLKLVRKMHFLRERMTKSTLVKIMVISHVLPGFRKKEKSPNPSGKKVLEPAHPAVLKEEGMELNF